VEGVWRAAQERKVIEWSEVWTGEER